MSVVKCTPLRQLNCPGATFAVLAFLGQGKDDLGPRGAYEGPSSSCYVYNSPLKYLPSRYGFEAKADDDYEVCRTWKPIPVKFDAGL